MNKRRICCFCETWASGGIESFLTNVLTHMDLSELSVDVVAVRIERSVFTQRLENIGIQFFELSGERNRIVRNSSLFCELIKKRAYDVIHVNAFHGGLLYYLYLAKKAGIPVRIAHSHCAALHRDHLFGLKMIIHETSKALFLRYATMRWACSKRAAEFLFLQCGKESADFRIIPNGIDSARFQINTAERNAMRERLGLTGSLVIGNVGRLSREKNQEFLLQVFHEVLNIHPESYLALVGEGKERTRLEAEAKRLGVEDRVIFCGVLDRVEQMLWIMDVFAFPSLFEGLGIAAIEAQAAGLPVVCSDAVPREAAVLPSAKYLPLDCGAAKWAAALCESGKTTADREHGVRMVTEKGYDAADVAKQIQTIYLGKRTEK